MRIRIRHANGMATLSNVSAEQTVLNLKQEISNLLNLTSSQDVQISGGYPPKPITITSNNVSLVEAGIRDGDTLNIKVIESTIPQQQITTSQRSLIKEGLIETPHGFLTLRVMDDDNSCLFRSIGKLCYVIRNNTFITQELRQVIVEGIKADPVMYSDATLGQPKDKYMEWILKPNSWGGAIEIDSIDVQTGRIDKFDYDALALAPASDSPLEFDQTRFSTDDESVLTAAKLLVDDLRKKHKYTDVANFTLKCEECKIGLKGEKGMFPNDFIILYFNVLIMYI
ncbi:uncharacterized protein BX663DRAFT_424550 [Cokeromyces recurvatus]|uniref:uncharacterized protein n=1 Tax=Cokeromyces recurvatus TaxID=90255 RepID=UPI0022202944|nr:uncharacterized protein BX663DRAFT_424550 [Cokeromyces recurvatus]KAI7908046.1 hypothetical protein BX663DRAFT_424550 [Cokeromyces recurvatus]